MNEGWGFTAGADKRKHISSLPSLRRLHSLSVFLTWCVVRPQREKHLSRVCVALCHGRNAALCARHSVHVQVYVRVCLGVWMKGRREAQPA